MQMGYLWEFAVAEILLLPSVGKHVVTVCANIHIQTATSYQKRKLEIEAYLIMISSYTPENIFAFVSLIFS